mmetsp:Transcript_34995/g.81177  ORF Transcript_34995/g.81177 Transcript_34995/m.81177 type:complete len:682 (+) Transcript_34995:81-2126(+)
MAGHGICRFVAILLLTKASCMVLAMSMSPGCALIEFGTDYTAGVLRIVSDVQDPTLCCDLCSQDFGCTSWSWHKRRDTCTLRIEAPSEYMKIKNPGVMSGLPGDRTFWNKAATTTTTTRPARADVAIAPRIVPTRLPPLVRQPTPRATITRTTTTATTTSLAPTTTTLTTVTVTTITFTTVTVTTVTFTTVTTSTTTKAITTTTEAGADAGPCTFVEPNVDYLGGKELHAKYNVHSWKDCCNSCYMVSECRAWTWGLLVPGDTKPSVCFLKSLAPQPAEKRPSQGIYSGLPGRHEEAPGPRLGKTDQCGGKEWGGAGRCGLGLQCVFVNKWYSQCREDPEKAALVQKLSPTLFCWSVVTPGTTEPGLMLKQWVLSAGLFSCDAHTIISNVTSNKLFSDEVMASQVRVSMIQGMLWAKLTKGPEGAWHALNTPVFIKAWQVILSEGIYKRYDWTLKLDVDAVIVPPRVKLLLKNRPRQGDRYAPLYLLNTGVDATGNFLHGPVEVLSQAAVDAYGIGAQRCQTQVDYTNEGEDWYLNACLKLIGVPGVLEKKLLKDAYMWGKKKVTCNSKEAVFHPAKTTERWVSCVLEVGKDALATLTEAPDTQMVMKFDQGLSLSRPVDMLRLQSVGAWSYAWLGGLAIGIVGTAIAVSRRRQPRTRTPMMRLGAFFQTASGEEVKSLLQ